MKLSQLIYGAVKNNKNIGESSFVYYAFARGDFDKEIDYESDINNAFTFLNEAVHRLSDSRKLPYIIKPFELSDNNTLSLSEESPKSIVNVVYFDKSDFSYHTLPFRTMGRDLVFVDGKVPSNVKKLFVEYIEDIPFFSRSDYEYIEEDGHTRMISDVELGDYGINNTMCSYIIEFIKGNLFENISPEIALLHLNRAEQYFGSLESHGTSFYQKSVKKVC